MNRPNSEKAYQLQLTHDEASQLATLLVQLVQENPPFWRNLEGIPEKMLYGTVLLCIKVVSQLNTQIEPSPNLVQGSQAIQ